MLPINWLIGVGLMAVGLGAAAPAEAANQLFHASWSVKAFGNECAASKVGTTGGTAMLTKYPHCQLWTMGTPARTGESEFYSIFGFPQDAQCNPDQPRCNFSETPTDGAGSFAPLGGSWWRALNCAPWYNFGGNGTTARPAKGETPRTSGKNKRPIPPLYRNPAFFSPGGAPNRTGCWATSTGYTPGGKGNVQAGRPVTGRSVPATRTAAGGFQFAAAKCDSVSGIRATGIVGEFDVLSPAPTCTTMCTRRCAMPREFSARTRARAASTSPTTPRRTTSRWRASR